LESEGIDLNALMASYVSEKKLQGLSNAVTATVREERKRIGKLLLAKYQAETSRFVKAVPWEDLGRTFTMVGWPVGLAQSSKSWSRQQIDIIASALPFMRFKSIE
jgi:formate-dependent phosphoribosylglycinamide formyltransferase (GAR transformylase)